MKNNDLTPFIEVDSSSFEEKLQIVQTIAKSKDFSRDVHIYSLSSDKEFIENLIMDKDLRQRITSRRNARFLIDILRSKEKVENEAGGENLFEVSYILKNGECYSCVSVYTNVDVIYILNEPNLDSVQLMRFDPAGEFLHKNSKKKMEEYCQHSRMTEGQRQIYFKYFSGEMEFPHFHFMNLSAIDAFGHPTRCAAISVKRLIEYVKDLYKEMQKKLNDPNYTSPILEHSFGMPYLAIAQNPNLYFAYNYYLSKHEQNVQEVMQHISGIRQGNCSGLEAVLIDLKKLLDDPIENFHLGAYLSSGGTITTPPIPKELVGILKSQFNEKEFER